MADGRPTLDTVAAAAGVSRMTVSNAYNRPDQLSAATRERVLAAAAELGYGGPDPAGRSLRRRQAGAVGVLMSEDLSTAFTDPGLVAFMNGLASELGAAGQAMLLIPPEADHDGSLVRSAIVDAFILCSVDDRDPAVAAVVARRLPIVAAGSLRLSGVPVVGIDDRAGAALAANHLLSLGHRSFGVVTRPAKNDAAGTWRGGAPRIGLRHRVEGFTRAVQGAGLDESAVVVVCADENTEQSGARASRVLLERSPGERPTAIFAVTDVLALGVLSAASDVGVRVPRELSIVGFDDIADSSRSVPALTTVAQSLHEQGVHAARMALALMAGEVARVPRINAELVVRGTTAAPRSSRGRGT